MATNTTTTTTLPPQETTTSPPLGDTTTSPPQEMGSSDPPPNYYPSQPRGDQEISAAEATTTTQTPAPVDEKRALQEPQPALVQPMQADGTTLQTQTQPRNLLDHPVAIESLRQDPGPIVCPHCKNRAMTRTDLESGNTVTAWAVAICCVLGVCCAWIPCVMDSCKDTVHFCSKCQNRVVTITNSGNVKLHSQALLAPAGAPAAKARAG